MEHQNKRKVPHLNVLLINKLKTLANTRSVNSKGCESSAFHSYLR